MRYLLTTILMFGAWLMGMAAEITVGYFSIKTRSDGSAHITAYKGNEQSLVIPSKISYNGTDYPITVIESLMARRSNSSTKEVFFPSSIITVGTESKLIDFAYNTAIETIVFENDDFQVGTYKPIHIAGSTPESYVFDNIIVLSKCNKETEALVSADNPSFIPTHIVKVEEISVYYDKAAGKTEQMTVQMFLYKKQTEDKLIFGEKRLNYLLSAFQKTGRDLSSIRSIDLSNLSKSNVVFETMSLPEACTQAQIITGVIDDSKDFASPSTSQYGFYSYSRTNAKDWNSVCLPFPIKESDFPENTKIYTMTGGSETSISLNRIAEGTTLPAGTPCFIYSEADNWNLYIEATISSEVAPVTVSTDYWNLYGSFTKQLLGEGKYKLNGSGTAFVQTTSSSNVYPFRCYIQPKSTSGGAPARLSVDIDDEASITLVPNDAEPQTVKFYDLMGRPRQGNASGLFIRGKH